MKKKVRIGIAVLGAVSFGVYLRFIRPWQQRWGATDEEVARIMAGDDVVKEPTFNATRAVTIQARPEEIWPWLVQMGVTRAGWYSYDLLDNLGHHSAEHILPQWQHIAVGDLIPFSPDGKAGMWVKALEPQQWMIWSDKKGDSTWYWGLFPQDESHTRLITRVRLAYRWTKPSILFSLLTEFTDIVMMRKCMLSIKQRAERDSVPAGVAEHNLPQSSAQSERDQSNIVEYEEGNMEKKSSGLPPCGSFASIYRPHGDCNSRSSSRIFSRPASTIDRRRACINNVIR